MVNQKEISWSAPEYLHYPKSALWFGVLSGVAAALVGYFLWQRDFLTAVMFALLFLMVLYFAKTPARTLQIVLDSRGVKINNNLIPYQQLKKFWIVYHPPEVKILNFETTAFVNRYLTLQLMSEDPMRLREFLLQYLPEDAGRPEQASSKLARTLRF